MTNPLIILIRLHIDFAVSINQTWVDRLAIEIPDSRISGHLHVFSGRQDHVISHDKCSRLNHSTGLENQSSVDQRMGRRNVFMKSLSRTSRHFIRNNDAYQDRRDNKGEPGSSMHDGIL